MLQSRLGWVRVDSLIGTKSFELFRFFLSLAIMKAEEISGDDCALLWMLFFLYVVVDIHRS